MRIFNEGNPVTAPYADVYLVDPTEKLFAEMGNNVIALQAQVFGTDHIYNLTRTTDAAAHERPGLSR